MKALTLLLCVWQIALSLGTPNRGKHEDFLATHEELTDLIDEMADLKIPKGDRRYGVHGHFLHHEVSSHCEHPRDVNCKMDVNQDCKDPHGCPEKTDPEPKPVTKEEEEVKVDETKIVVDAEPEHVTKDEVKGDKPQDVVDPDPEHIIEVENDKPQKVVADVHWTVKVATPITKSDDKAVLNTPTTEEPITEALETDFKPDLSETTSKPDLSKMETEPKESKVKIEVKEDPIDNEKEVNMTEHVSVTPKPNSRFLAQGANETDQDRVEDVLMEEEEELEKASNLTKVKEAEDRKSSNQIIVEDVEIEVNKKVFDKPIDHSHNKVQDTEDSGPSPLLDFFKNLIG